MSTTAVEPIVSFQHATISNGSSNKVCTSYLGRWKNVPDLGTKEMKMILADAVAEWAMPENEKLRFLARFDRLVEDAAKFRRFIGDEQPW